MLMIVAIVVVIALIATAFVVMPKSKGKTGLTVKIQGPDVLQVDAGATSNFTVVVLFDDVDVTNDTARTEIFWSISPNAIGTLQLKSKPEVPFKAAIEAATGKVNCSVKFQETPTSELVRAYADKTVNVLPPFLDSISISPNAKTIQPGQNWTFTATAVSSVGLSLSGVDFTWSVTADPGVTATPSATTGTSIVLGVGNVTGNANITATGSYSGVTKSGLSSVTVGYLPPRSLDSVWYDMFSVPVGAWYYKRWEVYKQEEPISTQYPWMFLYHSSPQGNLYMYTLMRLNVTGRNVSDINMNSRPEFLPILSQTERGGTAVIDWYMQYLTSDELQTRYSSFATQDDGWIIVLNGTVTLDKQAAKTVLNMTEGGYDSFSRWWTENSATVTARYSQFLIDEAEGRVDIENAYESYYQLFNLELQASRVGDSIVLRYDLVTWGMETLMLRWLHEVLLPIEMWYEDMYFHMTIGPEYATVDIDTAVTYALYATETINSMGKQDVMPCWILQPALGDAVESSAAHAHSDYDRYAPLSYLNRQPDSPLYGQYMQYDTVPTAWNLTDNETLTIKWPADVTLPFRYRVYQGYAINVTDKMVVRYSEPGLTDNMPGDLSTFAQSGRITVNNTLGEIEFVGPLNMYDWSKSQTTHTYLAEEWNRISILPYPIPRIEFEMNNSPRFWLDHLEISVASSVPANDDVTFKVTAINNYGTTYFGYNGTVNFTSSDLLATMPVNYTFVPLTDNGVHTFSGAAKFETLGSQTLKVWNGTDDTVTRINNSVSVNVLPMRNASSMEVEVYHVPAVGVPEDVTVTVIDQYGDVFLNYTGTVTFTTNRTGSVTLPADYTFLSTDEGVHTIDDGLNFTDTGWFEITASDLSNSSVTGSQADIWVVAEPEAIDHFTVTGIRDMLTRQKSDVLVTAYQQYGLVFDRYNGTISFSMNGTGGIFPADYTFQLSDMGQKLFVKGVSFSSPGVFNVTVTDSVNASAIGSQVDIWIQYREAKQTFTMYDMFEEPWHVWWAWRYKGYKTDIVLNNESGKYTLLYNADKRGNAGIIYAPYRWNMTGTNISQVSVHNPEFMPVLGKPDVAGAQASVDVYFQYLSWEWWNSYWKPFWNMPQATMDSQSTDGWYPGIIYTVDMNRAAAEEWLGMPQGDNPLLWWAYHGQSYLENWTAWILNEGNNRLDIWAGFEYPYINAGVKMKLSVLPNGNVRLLIGHLGEGYEILMTRWMNETNICNHEAYYEDLSMHVDYFSNWIDFQFDAVCQYSLRAVKANLSATNEPAWAWQPLLIDYVSSWATPGGLHPSKFDPWDPMYVMYQSWNAGDPSFGGYVPYDSGYAYFNLTDYQTFVIKMPLGNNTLGYLAQPMAFDSIRRILRVDPGNYDAWPSGDGTRYNYTAYWPLMVNGTMTLGWYGNWTGAPYLDQMWNQTTNTITMVGPMRFENTRQWNGALYFGAPWIEFNITNYGSTLSIPNPAPPSSGTVTAPAPSLVSTEVVSAMLVIGATGLLIAVLATRSRRID